LHSTQDAKTSPRSKKRSCLVMQRPTRMQGTAALLVAPSGKPTMSRRTLATMRINDAHPAGHALLRMPANSVHLSVV